MPYAPAHAAAKRAAWGAAHPDKVKASRRKWLEANREKAKASSLGRYYQNRDAHRARLREWAKQNPEKVRARGRRHDAKPARKLPRGDVKARSARWRLRHLEQDRARRRAYQTKRRQDPVQRVVDALRRRIRHIASGKAKGAMRLLGYSAADLRAHLEMQFQPGMTWDNYGPRGWHVDHRRPVSTFTLSDQLVECFALENLRPLWAADNLARKRKHAVEHT